MCFGSVRVKKADDLARRISDIAQRNEAFLIQIMRQAVDSLADTKIKSKVRNALARRDYHAAEAAFPWELYMQQLSLAEDPLRTTMGEAGDLTARTIPQFAGQAIAFDLSNPLAEAFIAEQGAVLVVEVTDRTREAIRNVVLRGFQDGLSPDRQAELLLDVVGLTSRQGQAVINTYIKSLESGMTEQQAREFARRKARKLHEYRAQNIARTETMKAAGAGQQEMYRQAVEQGFIDGTTTKREWIVTRDDRLCPLCRAMAGKKVGLEESFTSSSGPVLHPPLHPQCRCDIGLVFD